MKVGTSFLFEEDNCTAMIRCKFLIFALLLLCSRGYAQLFSYGPKIGMVYSSFGGGNTDVVTGGSQVGFNFGFFFIKDFSGAYIHFEPTFSTGLGGTIEYYGTKYTVDDISTLSLPILCGKKVNKFRFFFGLSPSGALNSEKLEMVGGYSYKIYFDFIVGAGVDVSNIFLNLRYSNALIGQPFAGDAYEPDIKIPQISLSAGLKLNKN